MASLDSLQSQLTPALPDELVPPQPQSPESERLDKLMASLDSLQSQLTPGRPTSPKSGTLGSVSNRSMWFERRELAVQSEQDMDTNARGTPTEEEPRSPGRAGHAELEATRAQMLADEVAAAQREEQRQRLQGQRGPPPRAASEGIPPPTKVKVKATGRKRQQPKEPMPAQQRPQLILQPVSLASASYDLESRVLALAKQAAEQVALRAVVDDAKARDAAEASRSASEMQVLEGMQQLLLMQMEEMSRDQAVALAQIQADAAAAAAAAVPSQVAASEVSQQEGTQEEMQLIQELEQQAVELNAMKVQTDEKIKAMQLQLEDFEKVEVQLQQQTKAMLEPQLEVTGSELEPEPGPEPEPELEPELEQEPEQEQEPESELEPREPEPGPEPLQEPGPPFLQAMKKGEAAALIEHVRLQRQREDLEEAAAEVVVAAAAATALAAVGEPEPEPEPALVPDGVTTPVAAVARGKDVSLVMTTDDGQKEIVIKTTEGDEIATQLERKTNTLTVRNREANSAASAAEHSNKVPEPEPEPELEPEHEPEPEPEPAQVRTQVIPTTTNL